MTLTLHDLQKYLETTSDRWCQCRAQHQCGIEHGELQPLLLGEVPRGLLCQ
jgi:hypothetical protein